ncbi:MAG: energy transducer TonB [Bacteroidales bacterium]|nr:energy transducer TonB [Bacteroidales bacterium]
MAKDVDLSSQGWRDLIFEGKNKEFGAYQMRKDSEGRHNKAMLIVLAALAVVLTIVILVASGTISFESEEVADAGVEQAVVNFDEIPEEEEIEEPEVIDLPEPEEQIEKKDVANEQQVTKIDIVEDNQFDEKKEVKDLSEVQENEAQLGAQDVTEGTNDLNKEQVKEKVIVEEIKEPEPEKIFTAVEQKPQFPGGEAALMKWLGDHIQYPVMAQEEGAQGRVVVQFVVERDGTIGQVKIARGRHPELDKEAKRLVKSLPKFIPGKNNGQNVRCWFTLPIMFKLQQ